MKKLIKISILILFMLLFFGITTSKAWEDPSISYNKPTFYVHEDTSAADMIAALDSGYNLTGINVNIKDKNEILLCRERHCALYYKGVYTSDGDSVTYPGIDRNGDGKLDPDELEENGYAKAYILAAPGYVKNDENDGDVTPEDERQYAWYFILGQHDHGKPNDLYYIALAYQNYKMNIEKDVEVTVDNDANAIISGENLVYGPIKVEYSYLNSDSQETEEIKIEKFDEWGGFNYAFFDKNGNNISDKIQLCVLENGTYKSITSELITSEDVTNGFYKVRDTEFNNENLYIVTKDKTIDSVIVKIQENRVDYTAKVRPIKGKYERTEKGQNICGTCQAKMKNLIDVEEDYAGNLEEALKEAIKKQESFIKYIENGVEKTYKYAGYQIGYSEYNSNYYSINGKIISTRTHNIVNGVSYPRAVRTNYCSYCNMINVDELHMRIHTRGINPYCNCGMGFLDDKSCDEHILNDHYEENKVMYERILYNFEKFSGCGKDMGEKISPCGTELEPGDYPSQKLHIIETTEERRAYEIKLEIEIELSTSIEVIKKWEDFGNLYNLRPEDITLKVYRCVAEDYEKWEEIGWDEINWEGPLTEGVDYDKIEWTKNADNTWTGRISNLKRADDRGYAYYFKVVEEAPNYYNVTYSTAASGVEGGYSSDNYIRTDADKKEIIIINTIKYLDIDIVKNWEDDSNKYGFRPDTIKFNVFRSIDNQNWEKLTENTHYKVEWKTTTGDTWKATISQLLGVDSNGNEYYFKIEEQVINKYKPVYPSGQIIKYEEGNITVYEVEIDNYLDDINISGYVWLDGQTGIKPAVPYDGIMGDSEARMENIVVYLYYKNPETGELSKIAETKTDANGYYEFKDCEIGEYYVEFEYDGIHYEDTKKVENGSSKAFETDANRNNFNGRFQTITHGKSNDGTTLNYNYANNKSTLITTEENGKVKQEFIMNATTEGSLYTSDVNNLNLGLIKRGTDIALSTDVSSAEVNINGQKTNYTYNREENTIIIGNTQTSEKVSYNLNLYASDYYYRIRNYVSNDAFIENGYINENTPEGVTTGEELKVYVTYKLNLQNQSTETTRINEVKYIFDEKYTFKQIVDNSYEATVTDNTITINLNGLSLAEGETKTLYLLFEVNNNNGLITGDFSNKAEITSYSTDKGLIDVDSQPGNFVNNNQVEDDNDTAGGLKIQTENSFARKLTGKVFDSDNNQNVNDVIVQLIQVQTIDELMESKTLNESTKNILKEFSERTGINVFEYIWQETVSGTGKGLRLNAVGTELEEYTYTKFDGTYEFIGFIPGNYIVRFIYGDGTTYDMTGNVIKYNGQDYKSTEDVNYKTEWYNTTSYSSGASVARDNEARRLEAMAYSVEIDASKGVLLKLLNNITVEDLNETEKEILVSTYNNLYDPDITEVTTEVINKLLKEQVLENTWMCAETSKIKVAVDTENINNTEATTTVNGINRVYVEEIPNINLGLELRPATKIELKKYITGFKLVAANGQTLVNAFIDVNEYLNDSTNISNKVQGIRDNVTILDTVWQYEVAPTDINTIVDGASLEFEYTLVVKNTGNTDYLSAELADAYNNSSVADYVTTLTNKANEIKGYMRAGTYRTHIGTHIGNSYYSGGTGAGKVLTEITSIRDYINNDLKFISSGGDVAIDENASHTYRILRDDYTMQQATINTVLKTTRTTGKMENDGTAVIYKVALGKNPISSTGNLNFENYIAEVMSYTNAAGRRVMYYEDGELKTATPGNAEIIDHEHRAGKTHEIDEADTARIQIGAATGEDGKTNFILITTIIAGIVIVAAGAFAVKKYVIK